MNFRAPCDFDALLEDVFAEAKKATGTWSLATHARLDDTLRKCKREDLVHFIERIIQRLTSEDAGVNERFKLVQLCTMTLQKRGEDVKEVFDGHKMEMQRTRELVSKESLGLSVVKLINSIYDSPRARVVSQSPTGSLNMRAVPRVMSKRIVYSKTPTV